MIRHFLLCGALGKNARVGIYFPTAHHHPHRASCVLYDVDHTCGQLTLELRVRLVQGGLDALSVAKGRRLRQLLARLLERVVRLLHRLLQPCHRALLLAELVFEPLALLFNAHLLALHQFQLLLYIGAPPLFTVGFLRHGLEFVHEPVLPKTTIESKRSKLVDFTDAAEATHGFIVVMEPATRDGIPVVFFLLLVLHRLAILAHNLRFIGILEFVVVDVAWIVDSIPEADQEAHSQTHDLQFWSRPNQPPHRLQRRQMHLCELHGPVLACSDDGKVTRSTNVTGENSNGSGDHAFKLFPLRLSTASFQCCDLPVSILKLLTYCIILDFFQLEFVADFLVLVFHFVHLVFSFGFILFHLLDLEGQILRELSLVGLGPFCTLRHVIELLVGGRKEVFQIRNFISGLIQLLLLGGCFLLGI